MALTKEQLDAINDGDAQRAYDSKLCQLRAERDKALKRADFAESVSRSAAADAYKAIDEMHEAKRHLRQLLHALDNMSGADLSYNVRRAMREARRYLQGTRPEETQND